MTFTWPEEKNVRFKSCQTFEWCSIDAKIVNDSDFAIGKLESTSCTRKMNGRETAVVLCVDISTVVD